MCFFSYHSAWLEIDVVWEFNVDYINKDILEYRSKHQMFKPSVLRLTVNLPMAYTHFVTIT